MKAPRFKHCERNDEAAQALRKRLVKLEEEMRGLTRRE
jgi:hypothetical protein